MKKNRIIPYDDYNSNIPPKGRWDFVGAITPQFGNPAVRHGWKMILLIEE